MVINELISQKRKLIAKATQLRNDLDTVKEEIHSIDERIKLLQKRNTI